MTDPVSLSPSLKRVLAARAHDLALIEDLLHYRRIIAKGGPKGFAAALFVHHLREVAPFETRAIDAEASKGAPLTEAECDAIRRTVAEAALAAHEAEIERRKDEAESKARRLRALRAALT